MLEKSCGTLPYTIKNGVIHYLLVMAEDDGYCGFPKGHAEDGETEAETAFRETWEETSIAPEINTDFRYEISYITDSGNFKTVVYFLAKFQDQVPMRNSNFENFRYLLLPLDEACQALTFENARIMLKAADEFLKSEILTTKPPFTQGSRFLRKL